MLWRGEPLEHMSDKELYEALEHFRRTVQQYRMNVREAKKRGFEPSGVFPEYFRRFMGAFRTELRVRQLKAHGQ